MPAISLLPDAPPRFASRATGPLGQRKRTGGESCGSLALGPPSADAISLLPAP